MEGRRNPIEDVLKVHESIFRNKPDIKWVKDRAARDPVLIYGQQICTANRKIGGLRFDTIKNADVRVLQADPANKGAVFQVASNFHGLEQTHANSSPERTLLEEYIYDRTQGPTAVLATAADLVHRRYLLPTGPYTDAALRAGKWPLDMLVQVRAACDIEITCGGWMDTKNAKVIDDIKQKAIAASMIASVHVKDALVTHDQFGRYIGDRGHRINHVLASACDMSSKGLGRRDWMDAALIAAYVNTLTAAAEDATKDVFLTLVGGGVFHNPIGSIASAMAVAMNTVNMKNHPHIHMVIRGDSVPIEIDHVERFANGEITFVECMKKINAENRYC